MREKLKHSMKRLARFAVDIFCNPALANYTAGPGSLSTGQSATAGRGGPYIRSDCPDEPTHMEFSMPLRQVFWT